MPTYEYGNLPQARKRIYLIAFADYELCDKFQFPEPIPLETCVDDIVNCSEEKNDIYYYKPDTDLWRKINAFIGNSKRLFRLYKGQIRNLRNPNLCPTLTASMNDEYNAVVLRDIKGIRRLTLRESLDMQGFPQDYYFPKTVTLVEAYRQIGNSVSVTVVRRVAKRLIM